MAEGALERSSADCALAVTGVLGPEPDEDANPVGLVFIARQWRGEEPKIERHEFGALPHEELCSRTLSAALDLIGAYALPPRGKSGALDLMVSIPVEAGQRCTASLPYPDASGEAVIVSARHQEASKGQ